MIINALRKGLMIEIILLFIVVSISPSIFGDVQKRYEYNNMNTKIIVTNDEILDQKNGETQPTGGFWGMPYPGLLVQSFKPTLNTLTRVELKCWRREEVVEGELIVSIRSSKTGDNLTTLALPVSSIPTFYYDTWVNFDFPDITVTPETTYYIVCSATGGVENDTYCWFFDISNPYPRGIAWGSDDFGSTWFEMWGGDPSFPEIDFCFITYWKEPRDRAVNTLFLNFLKNHPNMFPILRQLLGL